MDPRIERMADVLVNYSLEVKPGDWAVVMTTVLGEPLAAACQRAILRAGGNPTIQLGSEQFDRGFYTEANDEQLAFVSPSTRVITEQADARMAILAPANTRALTNIDPARMAVRNKAMEPLMETSMRRTAEGTYRWTVAQYPTQASAQDANMALEEYEDFVYGAGLLNEPEPAQAWQQLADRQQEIIDWLSDKQTVHITGPGTDLTVSTAGRTWINDDGKYNFPGGEVFTGPVEDATQGVIEFTFPGYLAGREVVGVRLVFEQGRVVEATATSGQDFLREMLDMDEGACRLGEFAFGTNYGIQRFTKNTLFDEKMGGTLHMALGRSYPESGGQNVSALHWDMVFDLRQGAEVTVDGQIFSKNGEIRI